MFHTLQTRDHHESHSSCKDANISKHPPAKPEALSCLSLKGAIAGTAWRRLPYKPRQSWS